MVCHQLVFGPILLGVGVFFVKGGTSSRETCDWLARGSQLTCPGVMSVAGSPVVTQQKIILCRGSYMFSVY